jgi:hypothetical protein
VDRAMDEFKLITNAAVVIDSDTSWSASNGH